ncbi:MAG TPA: class I SAM-dependent methyltransferase [Candidatus Angelobacter sp.]|nr:class I SAM-dependent methyltransferase [Candidatus Angelobacter sp.]
MTQPAERLIRNISDTALWVAIYRARENDRPDALFRDPYARKLAGERGEQIAKQMESRVTHEWPYIARTFRFDQILRDQIKDGADMVVNLAAGLDTRPYHMELPSSLKWVEVDLPAMIDYKEELLRNQTPRCQLRRVKLDLADVAARRALFKELGSVAKKALIISEGLIVYLSRDEVLALAKDLAEPAGFRNWAIDIASPGLLKMLQKELPALSESGSPLKFGPTEGPEFFTAAGWKPVEVYSMLKTASQLKRLPTLMLRLFALLPESNGKQGSRPWSGVCRLTKVERTV